MDKKIPASFLEFNVIICKHTVVRKYALVARETSLFETNCHAYQM